MLLIRGGVIHSAIDPQPFRADILIDDGKIVEIADTISAETVDEEFDATGMDVYPGFIDVHSHIGMFGYAPDSKDDVELYDRCTPHHRGIDAVNPMIPAFEEAVRAGVTAVCVGPGSVSCIAGTHLVLKTYGHRVDDMVLKDPVAMKVAFGSNPKKESKDHVSTRMTVAATIRDTLKKAGEYAWLKARAVSEPSKMPTYDPKLEALIPVIEKKIPLKAHVHRSDDIFTAIRIAKECDVLLTLEHVSDGGLIAEDQAKEGYPIAVGPYKGQSTKTENINKHPAGAVKMIQAGCNVSVMTDWPIISEEYLPMTAGLLMREGLDEFRALQTITINPAKHLGIAERVGSIEVGKDADIVVTKGCPMQVTVKPEAVFIDGLKVYSASKDS